MADLYNVTIAPEVLVEVARIAAWWREHRRAAPRLFQSELDAALLQISERPEIGRRAQSRRVGSARVVLLRRCGYQLFYQVHSNSRELLVVHIRHSRRRPLRQR